MQNISNNWSGLFDRRFSNVNLDNIALSQKNEILFNDIVISYKKKDEFKKHWIESDNKILLYWPPGTGKTLFVYILAWELWIPVLHVKLDTLISSYLWETWKNLRIIFEEAKKEECILFIDEFDSIAKKRDDLQELWELKRAVTVLLQNIDDFPSDNILITATNHEHLLDQAIWRRFDYQVNIDILDIKSIEKLLKIYFKDNKEKIEFKLLSNIAEWLSWALIKQIVNKSLRAFIINWEKWNINLIIIENIIKILNLKWLDFKENKNKIIIKNIITKLKKYNNNYYTFKELENITWIPDSSLNNYFIN
jgi:SpoVK/Ycf46/Vps4 family AAA+-type ATPase